MEMPDAMSFVQAVPMPAVLIRRDERIAALNGEAQRMLGRGIVGRHFVTALRQPSLLDAVEASLRDGAPRNTQFLSNDGQQDSTFRVTIRPVSLQSGRGVLVCFEDVTHLEQAGQMRRDFVANVSHELRTPLTALIGFIETLRGPAREDTEARERFLAVMEGEAARMNRLVGDLLSLSRVEAEERVRPTEQVDIVGLIRSTLNGLAPLATRQDARLEVEAPQDELLLPGDPDQLRQVFSNLVENALKYGGSGVRIVVQISVPEQVPGLRGMGVLIRVKDTGPGIDPVHVPRLTERFYRVDTHRSRQQGGTGLGLAIVKHIVNRHRGRLRIQSTPGEGTEIIVKLPVE